MCQPTIDCAASPCKTINRGLPSPAAEALEILSLQAVHAYPVTLEVFEFAVTCFPPRQVGDILQRRPGPILEIKGGLHVRFSGTLTWRAYARL